MAQHVGIVGASGYGGAELVRLLAGHPGLELAAVAADRRAGQRLADVSGNLDGDRLLEPVDPDRLAGLDLVFVATPHGPALELTADLVSRGTRVVDLSAAYRLSPPAFQRWYGESHPHPDLVPGPGWQASTPGATQTPGAKAQQDGRHEGRTGGRRGTDGGEHGPAGTGRTRSVYGLSEWNREAIAAARLVANPGCYPAAALLGLLPLAGLIEQDTVVIDGKSGTSGAGRRLRDDLHASHVHGNLAAYGAPDHRHIGEIEQWLWRLGAGRDNPTDPPPVSFTPHLIPMARGLLVTCYAGVTDGVTTTDVDRALRSRYTDEPFVRVLDPGTFPHTKALSGSNACHVSAVVDERTHRAVVTAAIDNLGKGAAGQAVQNANLMLGLDETAGLTAAGLYP